MTFSLVATPEPSHSPPRVLLTASEDDAALSISTCALFRGGVALRFSPTITGSTALAYDYDAPFDVALSYRADAVESGILAAFAETWASVASWTATGTGWAAAAGAASSPADGSTIYRDLGGSLSTLVVTTPTNLTVQLLDAAALVVASVRVAPDGNVTVTAGSVSTVVGSGTFTLSVSGSSLSVSGSGWSATVDFTGPATRVKLVAPSTASYVSKFGTVGTSNGLLSDPKGIAFDATGNIYVVDSGNNRVQKFNSLGVYQSQFGTTGSGNGQFAFPRGIAFDATGNIYVVDQVNNRVQKFNSAGTYQSQFGSAGSGNGQFVLPTGIAFDGSGNIYVVDSNNNRVQKFNSSGVYQSQFGTSGTGNGQFNVPQGIAFDGSGNIYVVDSNNNRVQKFNSLGVYQSQFGSAGSGNGQFSSPRGIAFDGSGNIYVVDSNNNRVQKFNSLGVYQSQFGSSGSGNGQLSSPQYIAKDTAGALYITETGNDRVQKFTPAGSTVDDITANISTDDTSATASDDATLTGITAAWLTNTAQPDLALEIDDCTLPGADPYITDESRRQTTSRSTSVQLDIEGSAEVLTVVTGPRKRETWTLELACRTETVRDQLLAVLANNASINLRFPATMTDLGLDDGFYAVGDVATNRDMGPRLNELATVQLPLTPSRAPSFDALWDWNMRTLAQTGMTMADAAALFPTMRDMLIGPTS